MSFVSGKLWLPFLFAIITLNATAQSLPDRYLKDIAVADSLFRLKQYCEAARNYRYAFGRNNFSADFHVLICAKSWQNCGERDSALSDLTYLVFGFGFSDTQSIDDYFKGSSIQNIHRYKLLLSYSKRLEKNNHRPFRKNVASLLDSLYFADQDGRSFNTENSVPKTSSVETVRILDSLYTQYGWLSRSETGYHGSDVQFLIIQHATPQVQIKWKRRIKKGVKQGLILPPNYATFRDRILLHNKKPQIYGTQVYFDTAAHSYQPFAIRNRKNVDKRRLKVGLNRLNASLRMMNHSSLL